MAAWVDELIERHRQGERQGNYRPVRPKPVAATPTAPKLDINAYYEDFGSFRDLSRVATEQENIRSRNREAEERRKQQMSLIAEPQFFHSSDDHAGLGQPLANFRKTSPYGWRTHPVHGDRRMHTGIDLAAPMGTPIYATHSGRVATSGMQGGYGNLVVLDNGNGLQTYYAHNSQNTVRPGDVVQRGQLIGYVGSTGVSTGPHLHYEVRINGRHVNPAGYM